ncbi:uncharacterized protein IL334_002922 [Kwoniella shivajii]|uniref:Dynactin 2 n=1 Tax=Kwoniella shivajii TaxID=564305 RepID=A0ABZ1CWG6_9TREE|nr:hypothetical protein IL334_002922 [Kwoniella shivajii]
MSKYQGLPDIDTAPDIFETPDEPDTLLRPADDGMEDERPSKSNSDNIDLNALPNRRKAERVFGRGTRRKDPKDITFRPRLPPLSRHALSTSSSSSDDDEVPIRESAIARIRRLKAELAEVEAEIASSSSSSTTISTQPPFPAKTEGAKRKSVLPSKQPFDAISELSSLKDRLGRLDINGLPPVSTDQAGKGNIEWRDRLEKLNKSSSSPLPSDEKNQEEHDGYMNGDVSLGEIDKRLAMIESALGPVGDGLDQNTAPLLSTLAKHSHLLSLLTQPRHMDAISRRIKLLLVDLDRAQSSKRNAHPAQSDKPNSSTISLSQNEYQSLQQLFNLLPRLDPLLPILQPLLARLRSLSGLHAEASEVADSLRKLQNEDKSLTEEIKELQEVTKKVENGLERAIGSIGSNWEGTECRLKALEERLRALEN